MVSCLDEGGGGGGSFGVTGELGPQGNSFRGDLGPLVFQVPAVNLESQLCDFHVPVPYSVTE